MRKKTIAWIDSIIFILVATALISPYFLGLFLAISSSSGTSSCLSDNLWVASFMFGFIIAINLWLLDRYMRLPIGDKK